jgi:5-methylcytosine-specific restriction endonuclease McrA
VTPRPARDRGRGLQGPQWLEFSAPTHYLYGDDRGRISSAGRDDLAASPDSCPALVLNADFRPLSYFPLSLWSWQEAVKAVFLERVNIVSEYEQVVRSPRIAMRLPSVISLKEFIPLARRPAFTRFNVFLRDRFSCQYCGEAHATHDLTFDHVVPRSLGGRTIWTNVVTACQTCNLLKGNRLPRQVAMHPRTRPYQPTTVELQENGRAFPPNYLHESWRDFLYWDTELDPS